MWRPTLIVNIDRASALHQLRVECGLSQSAVQGGGGGGLGAVIKAG